jgi:hypothetical protein
MPVQPGVTALGSIEIEVLPADVRIVDGGQRVRGVFVSVAGADSHEGHERGRGNDPSLHDDQDLAGLRRFTERFGFLRKG